MAETSKTNKELQEELTVMKKEKEALIARKKEMQEELTVIKKLKKNLKFITVKDINLGRHAPNQKAK